MYMSEGISWHIGGKEFCATILGLIERKSCWWNGDTRQADSNTSMSTEGNVCSSVTVGRSETSDVIVRYPTWDLGRSCTVGSVRYLVSVLSDIIRAASDWGNYKNSVVFIVAAIKSHFYSAKNSKMRTNVPFQKELNYLNFLQWSHMLLCWQNPSILLL